MDVKFVNPVLKSIVNVLSKMAQLDVKAGTPQLKRGHQAMGVVTGVIEMKGTRVKGVVSISFTRQLVLEIAKRMMHRTFSHVDEMVQDLVAEIANMMSGGARSYLVDQGDEFEMALPNVMINDGDDLEYNVKGDVVLLPFDTEYGEFYVEICFEE